MNRFRSFIARFGTLTALFFLCLAFTWTSEHFLSRDNLVNILQQTTRNGILAVGLTFVILTAGIDLSVGSVLAFAGVVAGSLLVEGASLVVAVLAGFGVGLGCGVVNGLLIAYGKLPPFIATLGMMSVARGLALVSSSGRPVSGFPTAFINLWHGSFLGVPLLSRPS